MSNELIFEISLRSAFDSGSRKELRINLLSLLALADRKTEEKLGAPPDNILSPDPSIRQLMAPRGQIMGVNFFDQRAEEDAAYRDGRIDALTDIVMLSLTRGYVRELVETALAKRGK